MLKALKKRLPNIEQIRGNRYLRFLNARLHDRRLWSFNRRSVSHAAAIGGFVAFIPIPLQMIPSAFLAIQSRSNVPIAVGMIWITNPLTIPPFSVISYKIGAWILGRPPLDLEFSWSFSLMAQELANSWQPFFLGLLILATISACFFYTLTHILWHLMLLHKLKKRRLARQRS